MTVRCDDVQRRLLDGEHDHDHLGTCASCRRAADALARVDAALARGPVVEAAPDLVGPVLGRIAARPRSSRLLLARLAATVLVTVVIVAWALAVPAQTDRYVVDEADAKESLRGLWSNEKKPRRRAKPRSKKKKK